MAQRYPWPKAGWDTTVLPWLHEQLVSYQIMAIEQFVVSDWSCILRIATEKGDLYLKCCHPTSPHEPALTQTLSRLWPASVPHVLAINNQEGWLLMEDAGNVLTDYPQQATDLANWQIILANYARLQIEAIEYRDHFIRQGCPDRRLEKLPALFAEAIADTDALLVGKEGGLTKEEFAQLHSSMPRLKAMCEELASYGLPETLIHDDLYPGNILVRDGRYIFFDWAESVIAHPFYSLAVMRRYARLFNFNARHMKSLDEIYLNEWAAYAPVERLREAFKSGKKLGMLCRGLTWYYYIRQVEPDIRQKYEADWTSWLHIFLRSVEMKTL